MGAWNAALDGVRAPIAPSTLAGSPYYGPAADAISAFVYRELYLAPSGSITTPVSDAAGRRADCQRRQEHRGERRRRADLSDAPRRRRRFRHAQNNDAFLALTSARATIEANLWTLGPGPIRR